LGEHSEKSRKPAFIGGYLIYGQCSIEEYWLQGVHHEKFEAISSKTYILHLDRKGDGSGTSTAMVACSAYQSDEKTILCGIEEKFAYTNPRIISGYTGTVYIKIYGFWEYFGGYDSPETGTYSVKYEKGDSNDTRETTTALSNGNWTDAQIWPRYDEDWYRFEASGGSYSLSWDDSDGGSGNSTCNITVSEMGAKLFAKNIKKVDTF
jgi:hypothetical protein